MKRQPMEMEKVFANHTSDKWLKSNINKELGAGKRDIGQRVKF